MVFYEHNSWFFPLGLKATIGLQVIALIASFKLVLLILILWFVLTFLILVWLWLNSFGFFNSISFTLAQI